MRRKRITRQPVILPIVLALLIVSAIGGWTLGAHWRPPPGALCQTSSSTAAHPTKLMVIIGENESQTDVNNTTAPFERQVLSKQCGSLRDMHAITHGSEPNYIAMTSGAYPSWALCDQPPNTPTPIARSHHQASSVDQVCSVNSAQRMAQQAGGRTSRACPQRVALLTEPSTRPAPDRSFTSTWLATTLPSSTATCPRARQTTSPLGNPRTMSGAFYTDARAGRLPKVSVRHSRQRRQRARHDTDQRTTTSYPGRCASSRPLPTTEVVLSKSS